LGLPLAEHLVERQFSVKGSTTTPQKIDILRHEQIEPFFLESQPDSLKGEKIPLFFNSDILFLNIPFKRNLSNPIIYQQQIEAVVKHVESSTIKFLIFASTTAVYPDSLIEAREDSIFESETERSRVLYAIEQSLLKNNYFDTTVIRFGGLCGGERRIGKFLAGQKNLMHPPSFVAKTGRGAGGDWPVNLIHLDDCVAIVTQIIENNIRHEIFNACCDDHPTRRELYTQAALKMGQKPPEFDNKDKSQGKIVSNKKLKKQLGYTFKYSSPFQFL